MAQGSSKALVISTPHWPAGVQHMNVGAVLDTSLIAVTVFLARTPKEGSFGLIIPE